MSKQKLSRTEFEETLVKDFPNLFADMHGDMRVTCMHWGIDTGRGWYPLLYDLSEKLEKLIVEYKQQYPKDEYHPRAAQVKEKYGSLRFYMSSETDEMDKLIQEAENKSFHTCESCGNEGILNQGSWYEVRCKEHWRSVPDYDTCLSNRNNESDDDDTPSEAA